MRTILLPFASAIVGACLIIACTLALGTTLAHADARSVSYAQRNVDAEFTATLPPHARVTVDHPCGYAPGLGYGFTEYSAYHADGSALGAQHRDRFGIDAWSVAKYARVTYFRGTFANRSNVPVMVAGWCG